MVVSARGRRGGGAPGVGAHPRGKPTEPHLHGHARTSMNGCSGKIGCWYYRWYRAKRYKENGNYFSSLRDACGSLHGHQNQRLAPLIFCVLCRGKRLSQDQP